MDDNITNLLDNFEVEEVDKLLENEDFYFDIDNNTLNRIKASVFNKSNIRPQKRNQSIYRKIIGIAAAFIIIFTIIIGIGPGNIAQAFNKFFSFIPGVGIFENNEEIKFMLKEQIVSENDKYKFKLINVVVTNETVSVFFKVENKDYTNEYKDKEENTTQNTTKKINLYLFVDNEKINASSYSIAGGGSDLQAYVNFDTSNVEVSAESNLRILYDNFNFDVNFELIDIEKYDNLNKIGATEHHNNISITATSKLEGGKLYVDLYPINKSCYKILGYSKIYEKGFHGKDVYLTTNSRNIEYNAQESSIRNANASFVFDINEETRDFVLNIPYIIVETDEYKDISLPIPKKEGEVLKVNKKVKFNGGIVKIVSVERTSGHIGDLGELKINLDYENSNENMKFISLKYNRINFWGHIQGSSSTWELDDNEIQKSIYIALEEKDNRTLRLRVTPKYILTDEYKLKLDSK